MATLRVVMDIDCGPDGPERIPGSHLPASVTYADTVGRWAESNLPAACALPSEVVTWEVWTGDETVSAPDENEHYSEWIPSFERPRILRPIHWTAQ